MNQIDGLVFKNMIISGANHLANSKNEIDALNIFPVPDGDTGTNMSLTLSAVATKLSESQAESLIEVASTLSDASLRGARGNSGVILSQICRGISKVIKENNRLDCEVLALALKEGADTAYKAILSPTEGTILTVIRDAANFAMEQKDSYTDIDEFFTAVIEKGNETLEKTPEMLPVLKSAGVVDAGGKGLLIFFEGANAILKGNTFIERSVQDTGKSGVPRESIEPDSIEFTYCTEFIIHLKGKVKTERLKKSFSNIGASLVLVEDQDIIKVHVHSNEPDIVLGIGLKYGYLSDIKIDNMKLQAKLRAEITLAENENPGEKKPYGFVCVSMGEGLSGMFAELGVDAIIKGGQTMNPSTEDLVLAIESVPSDNIFILPNNKNIIPAANQAKDLSDKNIYVVPTKTITQAISCLLNLDYDEAPDEMFENMLQTIKNVKPASITYAARDSKVDGLKIKKGDILGMAEGGIKFIGKDTKYVLYSLLDLLVDENSSLISVFYGEDISEGEAQEVTQKLQETYKECDVSVYNGGQPLYYYFISVE